MEYVLCGCCIFTFPWFLLPVCVRSVALSHTQSYAYSNNSQQKTCLTISRLIDMREMRVSLLLTPSRSLEAKTSFSFIRILVRECAGNSLEPLRLWDTFSVELYLFFLSYSTYTVFLYKIKPLKIAYLLLVSITMLLFFKEIVSIRYALLSFAAFVFEKQQWRRRYS